MSLSRLSSEILLTTLNHLDDPKDMKSCMLVNRRFHNLFIDRLYQHNVDFQRSEGLLWAAWNGYDKVVQKFIDWGADVEVRANRARFRLAKGFVTNITQSTPLHLAARSGHMSVLEALLNAGAKLDAMDQKNQSPILVALIHKQQEAAIALLKATGNILNFNINEFSPLHLSSRSGLPLVVTYLLEERLNVDTRDDLGLTALHHVLLSRCCGSEGLPHMKDPALQVVKLLLKSGADPEAETARLKLKFGGCPFYTTSGLVSQHPNPQIKALFKQRDASAPGQLSRPAKKIPVTKTRGHNLYAFQEPKSTGQGVSVPTRDNMAKASCIELSSMYEELKKMMEDPDSLSSDGVWSSQTVTTSSHQRVSITNAIRGSNNNLLPRDNPLDLSHFPELGSSPILHLQQTNTRNLLALVGGGTETAESSNPIAAGSSSVRGTSECGTSKQNGKNQRGRRRREWKPFPYKVNIVLNFTR